MTKKRRGLQRIVALFPELLGVGGIQEASRLTAAALHEIAERYNWSTEFLALNDPSGPQVLHVDTMEIPFRGFARSKVRFARSALQAATGETRVALAAHPHLAVPAAQIKVVNRASRMITISHGIEAWKPLPFLRGLAFLRSDLFLAPSRYTAEKITAAQGARRDRVHVVPWPISPEVLRMEGSRENLPLPTKFPDGLVILTVARLVASERYKGIDKLIAAVAILRRSISDVHLVIVGGGDDLPRHMKLAIDLGAEDCVHFFDNLSRGEIAGCYSRSDVFAMPSTGEGFGLVFLEAMAFGLPLIGAGAGGVPDLIEDGTNGYLVAADDLDQLCQALKVLLANEQLRAEMGKKGRELVRRKYSFEDFSAQLESILRCSGLESAR
jgi:phosphatidyl-myo-inositol dimannoside synthase